MRYNRNRSFGANPVWVIILINFLVAIAALINQDVIFRLGLNPLTFTARPWTILTSMFVHGGFFHFFFNMITLYFFGSYLSRMIGEGKFLIVYFGGGILGGILYVLLAHPLSIAVGASGAIFALGGTLAVMRPRIRVMVFPIPVPIPLWIAVIGGFIILSFLPGIAWQAHLGGLVFGLVAGYLWKRRYYFY